MVADPAFGVCTGTKAPAASVGFETGAAGFGFEIGATGFAIGVLLFDLKNWNEKVAFFLNFNTKLRKSKSIKR